MENNFPSKEFMKRSLNCAKSIEAFEDIIKQFEIAPDLKNGRAVVEWQNYNDNYAGMYLDEAGYLNFCTVNIDKLDVGRHAGQVIHRKFKYSYKHLYTVQMMIADSFMGVFQGVCSVGIVEKENLVRVEVRDNIHADSHIERLIEFLKNKGIDQDAVRIEKYKGIDKLC